MFDTSRLTTTDGRAVLIVDPGTLSRISGPDFRNARIELDGRKYSGDIEFHRSTNDWKLHHHQHDQNYNSVILHIVFSGTAEKTTSQSGRDIPTVVLEPFLFTSLDSIADQLKREEYASKTNKLPCAHCNDTIAADLLQTWIRTMYRERLHDKISRLSDRLREIIQNDPRIVGEPGEWYGDMLEDIPLPGGTFDGSLYKQRHAWEQLLYEEVMDCLGYSNNRRPMKMLAEHVSILRLLQVQQDWGAKLTLQQIEAILFTASGLLPAISDVRDQDSKLYIHSIHSAWNELPHRISFHSIDATEWNFSPTRPANFPTIRIAAAASFLNDLLHRSHFRSIVTIISGKYSAHDSKTEQLIHLFESADHSFWNNHFAFAETTDARHALLGQARISDIITNAVIPFVCLYATIFGQEETLDRCLSIAVELPALEGNSILKTMDAQVVKGKSPTTLAYQQQGLIHLYKRYCLSGRCGQCEIGKEVFS